MCLCSEHTCFLWLYYNGDKLSFIITSYFWMAMKIQLSEIWKCFQKQIKYCTQEKSGREKVGKSQAIPQNFSCQYSQIQWKCKLIWLVSSSMQPFTLIHYLTIWLNALIEHIYEENKSMPHSQHWYRWNMHKLHKRDDNSTPACTLLNSTSSYVLS